MEILYPLALLGIGLLAGFVCGADWAVQHVPPPDSAPPPAPAPVPLQVTHYVAAGWTTHGGRRGPLPDSSFYSLTEVDHE